MPTQEEFERQLLEAKSEPKKILEQIAREHHAEEKSSAGRPMMDLSYYEMAIHPDSLYNVEVLIYAFKFSPEEVDLIVKRQDMKTVVIGDKTWIRGQHLLHWYDATANKWENPK